MDLHIELVFNTTLGRIRTIRVRHPDTSVSSATVKAAMESIIAADVLGNGAGWAISPRRAQLVEKSAKVYF